MMEKYYDVEYVEKLEQHIHTLREALLVITTLKCNKECSAVADTALDKTE